MRGIGMKIGWLFISLLPLASAARDSTTSDLTRRWQGAWVVRDAAFPGSVEAWNVHDDSVTVYEPITGRTQEEHFALQSPCAIVRTQPRSQSTLVTTNTFVFAPSGLRIAAPQAAGGLRRGETVTVCIDRHVYTFDTRTRTCRKWNETMTGSPAPATTECVLDARSFVVRPSGTGQDVRLSVSGDAVVSSELAVQVVEPQVSFPAAIDRANALVHR
jgi:hypothetical protein